MGDRDGKKLKGATNWVGDTEVSTACWTRKQRDGSSPGVDDGSGWGCTGEAAPVGQHLSGGVLSTHSTSIVMPGRHAKSAGSRGRGPARGRPWNAARADGRVGSSSLEGIGGLTTAPEQGADCGVDCTKAL